MSSRPARVTQRRAVSRADRRAHRRREGRATWSSWLWCLSWRAQLCPTRPKASPCTALARASRPHLRTRACQSGRRRAAAADRRLTSAKMCAGGACRCWCGAVSGFRRGYLTKPALAAAPALARSHYPGPSLRRESARKVPQVLLAPLGGVGIEALGRRSWSRERRGQAVRSTVFLASLPIAPEAAKRFPAHPCCAPPLRAPLPPRRPLCFSSPRPYYGTPTWLAPGAAAGAPRFCSKQPGHSSGHAAPLRGTTHLSLSSAVGFARAWQRQNLHAPAPKRYQARGRCDLLRPPA